MGHLARCRNRYECKNANFKIKFVIFEFQKRIAVEINIAEARVIVHLPLNYENQFMELVYDNHAKQVLLVRVVNDNILQRYLDNIHLDLDSGGIVT